MRTLTTACAQKHPFTLLDTARIDAEQAVDQAEPGQPRDDRYGADDGENDRDDMRREERGDKQHDADDDTRDAVRTAGIPDLFHSCFPLEKILIVLFDACNRLMTRKIILLIAPVRVMPITERATKIALPKE